jgi:hypothetical protein
MTTQTTTPLTIQSGDTLSWLINNSDYPASAGWQLHYTFIHPSYKFTIDSAASGNDHAFNQTAVQTASWVAGEYAWQQYATKAAERYTITTGNIKVLPNISAVAVGYDPRSHVKKTLDALEAWLEGKNPAVAEYEIAGRRMKYIPIADLLKLRDRYRMELRAEQAAANPKLAGKNKLQVRFG